MEEMETQQSLKLVPRGQADGSKDRQAAEGVEKERGRQGSNSLQGGPLGR